MSGSLLVILAGAVVSAALGALVMCVLVYWDGFRLVSIDERAPDGDRRRATFRRGHAAAAVFFVITGLLVTAAVAGLGRASAPAATSSQARDDGSLLRRLTARAALLADRVENFIHAMPSSSVAERFNGSERRVPPSGRPAAPSAEPREAVAQQALGTLTAAGSAANAGAAAAAAVGTIPGAAASTPAERQPSIVVAPPKRALAAEIVVREERRGPAPTAIPGAPAVVVKPELDTASAPATTLTPTLEIIPPREAKEPRASPERPSPTPKAETDERPQQLERADRTGRSVQLERADKLDRPQKVDRVEKVDRAEKLDRVEKIHRPEKVERPEKIEKVQKVERVERPDRSGRR
jgi:hypothetical protein